MECLSDIAADLNQPHREWYKDNKPFHITPTLDTDRYYFTPEKELLVIVKTQSVDSGHYRCEITDNSKTYTMQMDLIVVKEDFSQHIIIIGVVLVTVACIVVGSLIVWIILFYQKRKLYMNAGHRNGNGNGSGARVGAVEDSNQLTNSHISTLNQTQMTTLNRTYLRSPRNFSNQRPRSLAALELNTDRYRLGEDEHQPLTDQRSCLIVTTTNYQQMFLQRNALDDVSGRNVLSDDEEHLTLEFLRLNSSHDADHQQDHLSSKDSGTGSDAANKQSLEDFSITIMPNTSTLTATSTLKPRERASLTKFDSDADDNVFNVAAMHANSSNVCSTMETRSSNDDSDEFATSSAMGISVVYPIDDNDLKMNNNDPSKETCVDSKVEIDNTDLTASVLPSRPDSKAIILSQQAVDI